MILMPAWIFEETEDGYRALLGSEPRMDSEKEWIPKECVEACLYAPAAAPDPRFALLTLKRIPEEVRKNNPDFYRNVSDA